MKKMSTLFLFLLFGVCLIFPNQAFAFSWKNISLGATQSFLSIYQDGSRLVATANSGKIYYSDDYGKTWIFAKDASLDWYYDVAKFKTGELVAIGQKGATTLSKDGGKSWTQSSFGTTEDLNQISMKGDSGYLVGSSGFLQYFSAGNWNTFTTYSTENLLASYDVGDGKSGYIGGSSGLIWKTILGGTSWATLTTGTYETIRGLYFSDVNNGYAVGTKGTFIKTVNGGTSWSKISVDGLTDQTLYSIEGNGNVLVVVGEKIALVSEDAGLTWKSQSFATENYTFYDVVNNGGTNIWAVGTKDGVSSVVYQLDTTTSTPSTPPVSSLPAGVEVSQNSLVKLSCSAGAGVNDPCKAVYFYAADGKRHAFPNDKVYFSWFTDFSTVKEVSADFLASLTLGKNVTYRPGVKMVKFQTVPQVYAVAKGGTLRAIISESVAAALYGSDWNKKIDDISDVFYGNYKFGEPIISAADYDPLVAKNLVGGLSENF